MPIQSIGGEVTSARRTRPFVSIIAGVENPESARAILSRLEPETGGAAASQARESPGVLWGWSAAQGRGGYELSHAALGHREAILLGDPLWMEPMAARPCTAEEILRAWECDGPSVARFLDNDFLLVVADGQSGELIVVTDRAGGIRLYSTAAGGMKVLCTSYLRASRVSEEKDIDGDSLAAFFHLGCFPRDRTALQRVRLHPSASITRISRGAFKVEPYWHPVMDVDRSRPLEEVLADGVEAFNGAVREEAVGHSRGLLSLTAGIDSRAVLSSLLHERFPFEAYTHGFEGCLEWRIVRRLVKRHGIPHRFVPLSEGFTARLGELALESFQATEGEVSSIEKSHLVHVFSFLEEISGGGKLPLFTGGCGSILKGMFCRFLRDQPAYTMEAVDKLIEWNFAKRLPDIFSPEVPARDPRVLRDFVTSVLEEAKGGSFFQRLDYLYLVKYRRWGGAMKEIYRRFFCVRDPFASARLLDYLFPVDPAIKKAKLCHYAILAHNFPALQYDPSNNMAPALPLSLRSLPRFLPSALYRVKQVLRGFSRKYLPRELFPHVDYVDYKRWIRTPGAVALVEELLGGGRMRSAFLYDPSRLARWLEEERARGFDSFPLIDKMCTLELFFREVGGS